MPETLQTIVERPTLRTPSTYGELHERTDDIMYHPGFVALRRQLGDNPDATARHVSDILDVLMVAAQTQNANEKLSRDHTVLFGRLQNMLDGKDPDASRNPVAKVGSVFRKATLGLLGKKHDRAVRPRLRRIRIHGGHAHRRECHSGF